MKKTTIVSIVLALILAANAAAAATPAIAKKKSGAAALTRDKLFRRNHHNNDKKKRDDECYIVTCLDEGDTCNDNYYCKDDLYCIKNKCAFPKSEGGPCNDDYYECKYLFKCNVSYDDETPSVCIPSPKKVGDSCSVYSDYCPTETKCVYGVCTAYPTTVGADCEEEVGCNNNSLYCNSEHKCAEYPKTGENCLNGNCTDYHYCDDESNKCVKYPGENEDCHDYNCDNGLYCNENKCVKLPGLGEECNYRGCASGLVCDRDQDSRKDICYNKIGGEGEHCSGYVSCGDGLICDSDNSVCVIGECEDDDDCPSGKGCNKFKCTDFMTLEDGEECSDEEIFFCKEGSGCGRNESSSTGYSCMKITTKISQEIVCEDDKDCPSDSYCDCNWVDGKKQCIPYSVSNKTMLKYYEKLLTIEDEYSDEYKAYFIFISQYVYPVDGETTCYTVNYTLLEGDESSSYFSSDSSDPSDSFDSSSSSYISGSRSSASSSHISDSSSKSVSSSDSEGIASNMKPSFALSIVLFAFGLIAAMF